MGWISPRETSRSAREMCESPTTVKDYEDLAARCLQECLQLAEDKEGWTTINHGRDSSIRLLDKTQPGSPVNIIKTEGILDCSPSELIEAVGTNDLSLRRQWDRDLKVYDIIEDITPEISVLYQVYNAPFPVQDRDFVAIKAKKLLPDGTWVTYGTTINHDKKPPVETCVRAVGMSALFIRPIPGMLYKCMTVRIARLDPMGMIPKFVINMSKKKAAVSVVCLREFVRQRIIPNRKPLQELPAAGDETLLPESKEAVTNVDQLEEPKSQVGEEAGYESNSEESDSGDSIYHDVEDTIPEQLQLLANEAQLKEQIQNIQTLLKQLQQNTELMNRRLQALEDSKKANIDSYSSSEGTTWGKTAFIVGWPIVVLGAYYYWKKYKR